MNQLDLQTNERTGASPEAIKSHYDMGDDFFRLILGPEMIYSCALFEGDDDLVSAQNRKLDHHIAAAGARDADRVLDIGCGWGAMLRRLSDVGGVKNCTGLTLSPSQANWIRRDPRPGLTTAIQAYADMEHYYRPICIADDYDTEKYSGFVELQNTKVKDAILKAGFSLTDFSNWIAKGNIRNLEQVRKLPRILPDKKARDVFIKKDVKAALDVLEKPELSGTLKGASISQLARALSEAIDSIPYAEVLRLRASPEDDAVRYINDALESLHGLAKDLNAGG